MEGGCGVGSTLKVAPLHPRDFPGVDEFETQKESCCSALLDCVQEVKLLIKLVSE